MCVCACVRVCVLILNMCLDSTFQYTKHSWGTMGVALYILWTSHKVINKVIKDTSYICAKMHKRVVMRCNVMCTLHMCNHWVYRAVHKSVSQLVKCAVTYLKISCIIIQQVELQSTKWRMWNKYISLLLVYKNSWKWDHPRLVYHSQCCENILQTD